MSLIASQLPAGDPSEHEVADYLALTDSRGWELEDGRLVEKHVGTHSSWIGSQILLIIGFFLRDHPLGWAFHADTAYRCFPNHPNRVRKPDVSFIRHPRLTSEQLALPFIAVAPDLAVEVVSPNDTAMEVDRKVREYLDAGVRLVWVVNPDMRTIRVHRADGTVDLLNDRGQVSGEDVLPGLQFSVADLFKLPGSPS